MVNFFYINIESDEVEKYINFKKFSNKILNIKKNNSKFIENIGIIFDLNNFDNYYKMSFPNEISKIIVKQKKISRKKTDVVAISKYLKNLKNNLNVFVFHQFSYQNFNYNYLTNSIKELLLTEINSSKISFPNSIKKVSLFFSFSEIKKKVFKFNKISYKIEYICSTKKIKMNNFNETKIIDFPYDKYLEFSFNYNLSFLYEFIKES